MSLNIGAILISSKILNENERPAWMYREAPIEESDSGWRVLSGTEGQDYLDDPSNFKTVSAAQIISIDDSIKVNLLAPIGSSFEWDKDSKNWIPVEMGGF